MKRLLEHLRARAHRSRGTRRQPREVVHLELVSHRCLGEAKVRAQSTRKKKKKKKKKEPRSVGVRDKLLRVELARGFGLEERASPRGEEREERSERERGSRGTEGTGEEAVL